MKKEIGVIGAGSWGTTLANLLAEKGYTVVLWVFEPDLCQIIEKEHENPVYLPNFPLSKNIIPTTSIAKTCKDKDIVVSVTPSHVVRSVISQAIPHFSDQSIIVSASKGIENETLLPMSGVFKEILPSSLHKKLVFLSGPSFANEVIKKAPTAVSVASENMEVAGVVQRVFATPYFRVYTSSDVIGVELGGALKNVIAIAAGASDGLGFGHNTRAALITRGLTEITRLGVHMGANPLTFSGLSGLGDLILTCTGDLSRNRSVGLELGRGMKLKDILTRMKMVAEGVKTTKAAYCLAGQYDVEMPITEKIYSLLYEDTPAKDVVTSLMTRDLKCELDAFDTLHLNPNAIESRE
ncbi:MAG: NAD(P)H-dependent glycerol-3-phosphate dehydrogenase [Thermodesulfobacteriota bacterium]|nr:NAD(P)H-dependent glycerol-3-phosphate dehydrogenase [Thermodesulfobacteriota bacterium]